MAERKFIVQESLRHEHELQQLAHLERRHTEKINRELEEADRGRERRKMAMIAHEEINKANREARLLEQEVRLKFIKHLNVI
jgi:hypothetical protein